VPESKKRRPKAASPVRVAPVCRHSLCINHNANASPFTPAPFEGVVVEQPTVCVWREIFPKRRNSILGAYQEAVANQ
jgi:hypothetical protein